MNSRTSPEFWECYRRSPVQVREQARRAYQRFRENPAHPGLNFHPLHGYPGVWAVRVTLSHRAVCYRDGNDLFWFWIGTHADYDAEFS